MSTDLEFKSWASFRKYVSSTEDMAIEALQGFNNSGRMIPLSDVLDGQASDRLRETIPLAVRRGLGAFFSSSKLRTAALAPSPFTPQLEKPILDPAMGGGDLLIEATRHLPADKDLATTLKMWGSLINGRDTQADFVRLARARLLLTAISRGARIIGDQEITLENIFPGVRVGDGLQALDTSTTTRHIIMNPPFTHWDVPDDIDWIGGNANAASLFLAKAVEHALPGTTLTAILPDVIRTGSRYERLRSLVSNRVNLTEVQTYGQFDQWTDVDVFILKGQVHGHSGSEPSFRWWKQSSGITVSDLFTVAVGTVVPHRDPELQPLRHYLHAKTIPLGGAFRASDADMRGFQQRTFLPPFVVVRRTSRPGDRSRGTGTLVHGTQEVLVENHLIVLTPRDSSTATCERAVDLLNSQEAKRWLDDRIRCRHLTVGAIKEMPWFTS